MRKLVTIQEIKDIQPVENADTLEVAKVLGWVVVIKKGEFSVGDKVVYAEIDSKFPEEERFDFLRKNDFRIRTVKLRGQVSQGICFPLSILPDGDYNIGDDVTDILGVIKYEAPIPECLQGKVKGYFPTFLKKTGETRVQVSEEVLSRHNGVRCVVSEKLEGASATYYLNDDFGVCSRVLDLEKDDSVYWKIEEKYNIESKLRKLGRKIAIQGEIIGQGIEGNIYKYPKGEIDFFVFNIFDINTYSYLSHQEVEELAEALGIKTVPLVNLDFKLTDNIEELVELSKGKSKINPNTRREGLVIKSYEELYDLGTRISFKVINPDYLLKQK